MPCLRAMAKGDPAEGGGSSVGARGMQRGSGFVLAIDLGTGGPKAALLDASARLVSYAFEPVGLTLLPGGGAEQDPAEWWAAIATASRRALARGRIDPRSVVGIGFTAQWSGTVAVDAAGAPVRPAISWLDSRGATAIRRQLRGVPSVLGYDLRALVRLIRLTGGAPGMSGKDPVAHILWMRDAEPERYAATFKFLEPVDWLGQRLTGRFAASWDSVTLYWATDNRGVARGRPVVWDRRLCRRLGLDMAKLPELVPTGSVLGQLSDDAARDLGLVSGIPVATGCGDLHSAAIGAGAVADYAAHLYIGTSSWISCHVPFKRTDVLRNVASIPAALPSRYLVADEHETAGACLEFFVREVLGVPAKLGARHLDAPVGVAVASPPARGTAEQAGTVPSHAADGGERVEAGALDPGEDGFVLAEQLAANAPLGAGGVLFAPWLNGERTPVDDHTIRGGFHNLSLATRREHLARAVYEGVAFNSRWLLDAVEHFVGRPFGELAFVGGGAVSDFWCKLHADVCNRPVRQLAAPRLANARGAGLACMLALGMISLEEVPHAVDTKAIYRPDPAAVRAYEQHYRNFVALYRANRKLHRRMNGGRSDAAALRR
jgi:xylulokinase